MQRYRTGELLLVALFSAVVGFQVFVPPSIGLANNGDFSKLIGRFSLAPETLDTSEEYKYFTAHWIYDRSFLWVSEDRSSELIPISAAVLTGWWFSSQRFDIRILGAIHAFFMDSVFRGVCSAVAALDSLAALFCWAAGCLHLYRRQLCRVLQFVLQRRGGLRVPGVGGCAVAPLYKQGTAIRGTFRNVRGGRDPLCFK
jgi:hypothetical protein